MPTNHDSNIDMSDILIVDDESANLQLLSELLGREGYQVRPTDSPQVAIDSALARPPKLILLDVRMPEMDGFEVCRLLKQDERTREIPIIFISALQDVEDKVRGFEAGGVDFISKPIQEEEVLARVRTHLALHNMQLHLEDLVAKRTTELSESKTSLEKAQQLARIGSWSWDVKTDTVTWSKTLYEITGLDPKKPPPSYEMHPSLYTPESWVRLSQAVTSALNEGQPYDLELDMVRPDGLMRHTSTRGRAVKSNDGCTVRLFGTVQDITELKRATEELVKSEAKYRDLVDTSLVGVFRSKLNGQLIFINQALVRMFDFDSSEQMAVEGALALWADPNRRERFLTKLREQGYVNNFETEAITHTGRPIHVIFSATLNGENISGMVMDITDRKRAEQKLIDYQQRLKALAFQLTIAEEQERRTIAVDLHDHVGQSLALAHIQLDEILEAESVLERTLLVKDISRILLKALQDTRYLISDLSSPSMNQIGLAAAISEWLEEVIAKRRGLKTEFIDDTDDNHRKSLDNNVRALLFRNVRELLTNVIKHSRAQNVRVRLISEGSCLKIIVEDDGVGFNPDADNTKQKQAEGFGLFSIQERMDDLGGTFDIQSHPGKGCRVTLISPPIAGKK
jgi:PAS domain S-box-containing protein